MVGVVNPLISRVSPRVVSVPASVVIGVVVRGGSWPRISMVIPRVVSSRGSVVVGIVAIPTAVAVIAMSTASLS